MVPCERFAFIACWYCLNSSLVDSLYLIKLASVKDSLRGGYQL